MNMSSGARRIGAFALSGALLLAPVALTAAPSATAAPGDSTITLTSAQLTDSGFTKQPNVVGWGGTATISAHSGSFAPVGGISTTVKADGTYSVTFEVTESGRCGYTLGAGLNEEWLGVEFQLRTT
jgi:hypothetical protein